MSKALVAAKMAARMRDRDINDMTREEFENLPCREWNEAVGAFSSLVILPTEDMHDSNFRCMDFIACNGNQALCRLAGGADVIGLDGISGWGKDWLTKYSGVPTELPRVPWAMDCLAESGLLRLFASGHELSCGDSLSSFEIYATKKATGKE